MAAIADDIAYNSHDLDDGLRAGSDRPRRSADVPLAGRLRAARRRAATIDSQRTIYEVNRRMITAMIDDVVRESRARLAQLGEQSLRRRARGRPSRWWRSRRSGAPRSKGCRHYLFANVYRHPRVMRVMGGAERIVRDLFARYMAEPRRDAGAWRSAAERRRWTRRARAVRVADFVAGMTDRYAIAEHARLFDATPELR